MWQDIIKTVAPVLGTALGGPFGGMAAKLITGTLLGDDNATDDISIAQEAIKKATPADLLLLKQEDNRFKLEMEKLGVDVMKIDAADRDSARTRQATMHDWTPNLMAIVVLGFWGWVQYTLISSTVPPVLDDGVLARILGMLDAATLAVLYYFFGSSHGSKQKTSIMGQGK